ncbi:MAG: exopolyphosphatase, partial [Hyphomicrobiaceae bacterium]
MRSGFGAKLGVSSELAGLMTHRRSPDRPVAVVDVGSNSVRLVIFEALTRSPATLYNEKVVCGLGRNIPTKGRMGMAHIERALKALRRFRAIVDALDAGPMHIVATAAAREATDGPIFVAAAEEICGASVTVLTGEQEAALAASGVISGIHKPAGLAGDLGGGSLEIININNRKQQEWTTLPLGGLRLIEGGGTNFEKVRKIVDRELNTLDWLEKGADKPFYAVGGAWRAFARLHMAYSNHPLRILHHYRVAPGEAIRFARHLQDMPLDFFGGTEDLSAPRLETLPHGAAVMQRFIKRVKPSEIVICTTGIREGLHYNLLPKALQKEDAFLSTCRLLSDLRSRSPENDRELCDWTDKLFRSLALEESEDEKR